MSVVQPDCDLQDNTGKEEEQSNGSDAKRLKTESNGEEDSTSKESATAEQ